MVRIVLTADRAVFTDYNATDALGFGLCLPYRLVPDFVEYKILAPPIPAGESGRALYAPYALSKIEASLLANGFSREDVVITPPEHIRRVIDRDTEVVALHVLDPQGLAPVSWTLRTLSGGGATCTQYEFERLIAEVLRLKDKYGFKLVVGGPGAWQLRGLLDKFGIDVLLEGEGELTFPLIVKRLLNNEEVPRVVHGDPVPISKIPIISTPSRNGLVQVTRGCPRRCKFCNPTMWAFRSIPLNDILAEVELNLRAGSKQVCFVTEDVMLYGSHGLKFNEDAIKKLFASVKLLASKYGVKSPIGFSHVTPSSALALKDMVKYITEVCGYSEYNPCFPQAGLESGSPRLVAKYFNGKPYPWKARDWPWIIIESSKLLNEHHWYPCYTYIIGFPDADPGDYVRTAELLEELHYMGFKGWTFPLLLIPMGGSMLDGKVKHTTLEGLPEEAIDAILVGSVHSVRFTKYIYRKIISNVKSPLAYTVISRSIKLALEAMENWIYLIKKDPEAITRDFPKVNIRSVRSIIPIALRSAVCSYGKLMRKVTRSL